ncbi:Cps160 [Streptococcus suis TL13]|uniref:CPS16O n=1 Tax=Streptococcus suis TaxID=1307 RepID=E9NQ22_STRSU|nr:CPS16O [Streptococcus suis]AGL48119.1 Cps160 [Streptococcus suis TL13]
MQFFQRTENFLVDKLKIKEAIVSLSYGIVGTITLTKRFGSLVSDDIVTFELLMNSPLSIIYGDKGHDI